jgi:multidrug efflux system membrane fusion protein
MPHLIRSAAAVLALALPGCTASSPPVAAPAATIVDAVTVRHAEAHGATLAGIVVPRREIALAFKASGRLMTLAVAAGDHVRAGQVLARLAGDDAAAAIDQARAELAAAAAEAARARDAATRAAGLDSAGALAAVDVRDRALVADAAAARRDAASAALARSRVGRGDTVIVAPEDGVVLDRLAEPGAVVEAGRPVLRLAAGGVEVEAQAAETLRLAPGMMADASLWAIGDDHAVARLRTVAPAGDGTTRLRRARFTLIGGAQDLPLNSSATLLLREAAAAAPVRVPMTALDARGGRPTVWRLTDGGRHVRRTGVRLIGLRGDDALVAGLVEGTMLVASGGATLTDGQAVVIAGTGPEDR